MIERILINSDINYIRETILKTDKKYIQFLYNDTILEPEPNLEGDIICLVEQGFEDTQVNRYINCYSIQNRIYSIDVVRNIEFNESITRILNKLFLEIPKITIIENLLYNQTESDTYFDEAVEILDIFEFEKEIKPKSVFKNIILPERIFSEEKYQKYLLYSIKLNDEELDV